MKKMYQEDDKYIYETTVTDDNYIEIPKKKKRRLGLKIFFGITIPLLLLPFVIFGIFCFILYKNYENPQNIVTAETLNIKEMALKSLDNFFESEGREEYKLSVTDDTINKTLYTEVYLKQNNLFITDPSQIYFKTLGSKNSSFFLGLKGAWLKFDQNTIEIYIGADLIKPVKFKTGVSLTFKIIDTDKEKILVKLHQIKLGKAKISINLFKKIIIQLKKNPQIKKQIDSLMSSGFPANDPIITINPEEFLLTINKAKLLNLAEEKAKGHYDESKEDKVKLLFNHLRSQVLEDKIFSLNFTEKQFSFSLKANKIRAKEEFRDIECYSSNTRIIDLVKMHQQDILLNLNNVTIPTNFNIDVDQTKLPKLFRFFAEQNGYFASPIFKSGKKIKINGLKNSYAIRVKPVNMIGYSKDQILIEAYAYIFPINNETNEFGKEIQTNIVIGVKPEISDGDLKLVMTEFQWGETDKLSRDLLEGVFAFVKQKGIEDNAIVIKDIFKKFKNQSGFDCQEIIFHEDKISLKISLSEALADKVLEVKQKVIKVLQELKALYPAVSEHIDKLIQIAGDNSELIDYANFQALSPEAQANLTNLDLNLARQKLETLKQLGDTLGDEKFQQFKKDLFTQTTASLDKDAMKILNFG